MSDQYDLKSVKLPRLSGSGLKILTALLEIPFTSQLIAPSLLRDAGITNFRNLEVQYAPVNKPEFPPETYSVDHKPTQTNPSIYSHQGQHNQISDFEAAYRSGQITPDAIADQFIGFAKESNHANPPLRGMIAMDEEDIRKQAAASTNRWKKGSPLSVVDGVPIPIKDELDQVPYPTRVGTKVLGKSPAAVDSTSAARLRNAGALLVGKANMHEIGIGVTGLNPHYGTARNPYNPKHFSGGSSSGPAVSVAAGLAPVAIGADGGGSIRIPSSFCGLVGLKATFGRISEFGAAPLCWSVAHIGPLANSAADAAITYSIIAGPDELDANTYHQPPLALGGFDREDLSDLTIGVYWPWFRHASDEVITQCENMLKVMKESGAKIVDISVPNLEAIRVAHLITIASEMKAAIAKEYARERSSFGLDVRTNLALANYFTAADYVLAQRIRAQAIADFLSIFKKVDIIATPTTAITAPVIPEDAFADGESDLTTLAEIMRFAAPANLTGLPTISFPAGYTPNGLPVGFQAMARPWDESTLLRLAHFAEGHIEHRKPLIHWEYSLQ